MLRRFPAQRALDPRGAFRRPRGARSRTEPFGSCSFSRNVFFSRPCPPVRRRAGKAPGSSGPPDANEAGENRASRRDSHFGNRSCAYAVAFSSAARARTPASGISVASSELVSVGREAMVRAVARRPPRPVPRGPRERRALPRSEMPSLGSCLARPARTEMRTNPRRLPRSHGAHVMWIA